MAFNLSLDVWNLMTGALTVALALWMFTNLHFKKVHAPLFGKRFIFEPRWLSNIWFFVDAKSILDQGYRATGGQTFRFKRTDGDLVVLPPRFLDEINALPTSVANPTDGNMHNLLGKYTDLNILLGTDLHFRLIRGRLSRNLTPVMKSMQDELEFGVEHDLPECNGHWASINVYETILILIARTSARTFLGPEFARSPVWLRITTKFTQNLFELALITRLMPYWSQGMVTRLLPQFWTGKRFLKEAKEFLAPKFQKRLDACKRGTYSKDFAAERENAGAMLSHLICDARGHERDANYLAHMQVVLALASIHTVQVHIVNIVFDICNDPSLADMIREEVVHIYKANDYKWDRRCYSQQAKLDSFMRESQRLNPPSLLSFHRIMYADHDLTDGTHLPTGVHICMATNAVQNDPNNTPAPDRFEPLRYYNIRRERHDEQHLHQFANADREALNFGQGKHACPGRFFASLEMKLIISRLIMEYDFRLVEGTARPKSLSAYEFCFPDRKARVELKKRRSEVSPQEPF